MSFLPSSQLALLTAAAVINWPVVYASPSTSSLCLATEDVQFSCRIGAKILSVCASPGLSRTKGALYYRFGIVGKPELVYPSSPQHPSQSFATFFSSWAKGHEAQLSFKRGDLTYIVFAYESSFAGSGHGVAIYREDKRIAKLNCRGDVNNRLRDLGDDAIPEAGRRDVP